jgi:acetyl esterase/lipase
VNPRNRFLLSGIASAAVTANALRPLARFGPGGLPAFAHGLFASEFPLHTIGIQGTIGALAARGGGVRGLRGAVGLGLTAASIAGLWRLHREVEESEHVLERALVEGLGADYHARIAEPFSPRPSTRLTRRDVLMPDLRPRRRYLADHHSDLPYGEYGRRNHLDIWRRADLPDDAGAPVLFHVHGGAWVSGQKQGQAETLMSHMAERGWVCVSINYRLSPRSTWPDHIVDVKRALAWTKDNIGDHGGDPGFVAITGGSAGGHLCALAALTPDVAAFQPGFEEADVRVQAAVPFYGVYDFTNRHDLPWRSLEPFVASRVFKTPLSDGRDVWEQASPLSHVGPDAPPFFVLHGANDTLVPVEQARAFVQELAAVAERPLVFAELPRAQHAFEFLPSLRARYAASAVERFLAVVRSEHGGKVPAAATTGGP